MNSVFYVTNSYTMSKAIQNISEDLKYCYNITYKYLVFYICMIPFKKQYILIIKWMPNMAL